MREEAGKNLKWGPDRRWKAERENAWLGVVLGTGASVQNPVLPIATSSRLRHSGKLRHRIVSHPLLKADFHKHSHQIGGWVESHEIAIIVGRK